MRESIGHRHITANRGGRDFVAGDIHGMFEALEEALEACGFNPASDRLLSVGDLIDRGAGSEEALTWLESGRIEAAVLGNHEEMMMDALYGPNEDARARAHRFWTKNGGAWWDTRERTRSEWLRWRDALGALALSITLETRHGPVGIVHALPWPGPWSETTARCEREDAQARRRVLWGRLGLGQTGDDVPRGRGEPRAIIAGHFASESVERNGRVRCIDTGAGLDVEHARVTLACVSEDPITYHSGVPGGARVREAPDDDGEGAPAPVPWVARKAMDAIKTQWRKYRR